MSDLDACRSALKEERGIRIEASKEDTELAAEVVNQEAQLEWYANENKGLNWENECLCSALR